MTCGTTWRPGSCHRGSTSARSPAASATRNAATTLNVYSHFLAEADRDAADVLGRLFDDAVERDAVEKADP